MKYVLAACLVLIASTSANALDFQGKYGRLRVIQNPSGKLSLIDSGFKRVYNVNLKTGAEAPLDIDFLRFSRDYVIQEYSDIIQSATVQGQMASNGMINWIIKLKVNFDGSTTDAPHAIVVFTGTSKVAMVPWSYTDWYGNVMYSAEVKQIESTMQFDHVEAPAGQSSASASALQFTLNLMMKFYPSRGITSSLQESGPYWW